MKYLGSTNGAVISDSEVASSQMRTKGTILPRSSGALDGGSFIWRPFRTSVRERLAVGFRAVGPPNAVITAHAQM